MDVESRKEKSSSTEGRGGRSSFCQRRWRLLGHHGGHGESRRRGQCEQDGEESAVKTQAEAGWC